jgi:hypothetical protein
MADVKKMRNIPFLVNYCEQQKNDEVEFDRVDFKRLFNNSNLITPKLNHR